MVGGHFGECHFGQGSFWFSVVLARVILVKGHLGQWSFWSRVILVKGGFGQGSCCSRVILARGHFGHGSFVDFCNYELRDIT